MALERLEMLESVLNDITQGSIQMRAAIFGRKMQDAQAGPPLSSRSMPDGHRLIGGGLNREVTEEKNMKGKQDIREETLMDGLGISQLSGSCTLREIEARPQGNHLHKIASHTQHTEIRIRQDTLVES